MAHQTYAALKTNLKEITGIDRRTASGMLTQIHQELQPHLNEIFFTDKLIIVEGPEDVAYITTMLNLQGQWDAYRRSGCHIVQCCGKSHMIWPLLIATQLGIPTFVVFDADADKREEKGGHHHQGDNEALLALSGHVANAFPESIVWSERLVVWPNSMTSQGGSEIDKTIWRDCQQQADSEYGQAGKLRKHSLHIAHCLTLAWEQDEKAESLERLCESILRFGGVAESRTLSAGAGSSR